MILWKELHIEHEHVYLFRKDANPWTMDMEAQRVLSAGGRVENLSGWTTGRQTGGRKNEKKRIHFN